MEEGDEVDAGSVEEAGVHGFQAERVVRSEVVMLDLNHGLTGFVIQLYNREPGATIRS